MPIPIVLPITDFTRRQIEGAKAVALTNAAGVPLAIMREPESYELRVREIISRTFGVIDDAHPYIQARETPAPPRLPAPPRRAKGPESARRRPAHRPTRRRDGLTPWRPSVT